MNRQMDALVSIIIVNYNGKKWLKNCLDSVFKQTYKNFEVIVVDNASTDGSIEFIEKNYPSVRLVKLKKNIGFAGGNNVGFKYAKGYYIWLLNNDTVSDKNALSELVKAFKHVKNLGVVQSKLILMDDHSKLDGCGAFLTWTGFLYHYGYLADVDDPKFNKPFSVYSVKGASMMTTRDVIKKAGGLFDDDYFAYFEETDFCHRVWLAGYECWYWPKSVVYHKGGGTNILLPNDFIQFHSFKNKLLTYLKNCTMKHILLLIPVHLFISLLISGLFLLKGQLSQSWNVLKSILWNTYKIKATLVKREFLQKHLPKKKLPPHLWVSPPMIYFYYMLTGLEKYKWNIINETKGTHNV